MAELVIREWNGKIQLTVEHMGKSKSTEHLAKELRRIPLPEGKAALSLAELQLLYAKPIESTTEAYKKERELP